MRIFALVVMLLALSHQAFGTEAEANTQLASSASALESRSRETLGIGIRQLSLLLQAGPNGFFRKETLEKNGSWALLKELESKGFIAMTESDTLPDGQRMGSSVVSFSATAKGQAVLSALQGK